MNWKTLLDTKRVTVHVTSKQELDDLRRAVKRNLRDAALEGLSDDNKFGLAYEAGLLLAKMTVAVAGYRVKGLGAHETTIVAFKLAMGPNVAQTASYLERCRRKRNGLSYDAAGVVTASEAAELLTEAQQLRKTVEEWLGVNHPEFK